MTFLLPEALRREDDRVAIELLRRYFGTSGQIAAVGADFDTWDSTGNRHRDANRFTADDLVAVTFLSVAVPPQGARLLLRDWADEFERLLVTLGPDRDLADETEPLNDTWPGWPLMARLRDVTGVGTTIASKLLARKRPLLRPIWDSVVTQVTDTTRQQWEPLRVALRADGGALHDRLLRLHDAATLPSQVSALRVLDVICWREGKDLANGREGADQG